MSNSKFIIWHKKTQSQLALRKKNKISLALRFPQIADVLKGKTVSLTPSQRKTYGRVKYEKEFWIDKVK